MQRAISANTAQSFQLLSESFDFFCPVPHSVFDASSEDTLSAVMMCWAGGIEDLGNYLRAGLGLQTQWIPTAAHFSQRQLGGIK